MKTQILNNWAAKIASLVLASVLWFLIKKRIEVPSPERYLAPQVETPTDGSNRTQ